MNKRLLVSIFIMGLIAVFFYASAWTCEESVSAKWAYTGIIAIAQTFFTGMLYATISEISEF